MALRNRKVPDVPSSNLAKDSIGDDLDQDLTKKLELEPEAKPTQRKYVSAPTKGWRSKLKFLSSKRFIFGK